MPDYQGLGLGTRLAEAVSDLYREQGKRVTILASHPAILRHCEKSPLWRLTAALLDRFTHRCHIFEMNGESYRFRESAKAAKEKKSSK